MLTAASSRPQTSQAPGPSPAGSGWYYILHGDDELALEEELVRLRRKSASRVVGLADLNTTVFDGRQVSLGELRHVCDSIPFMEDRRVVIVRGLLSWLVPDRKGRDSESEQQEGGAKGDYLRGLVEYLPKLPPTTRLLLVEPRLLDRSHPVLRLARSQGPDRGAFIRELVAPKESELPGWVRHRVRARQGAISTEAAQLLATLIGRDLRLLDMELEKLLVYVGGRQVTAADVRDLVSQAREEDIFDLVDAVGLRQTGRALHLLHGLLEDGREPLYLLSMVARQVRILMQVGLLRAQELAEDEIARRTDLHPYVVRKALAQIPRFTFGQLEAAHRSLLDADWAIKTGRLEPILALDLLVVGMSRD